MRCTLCNEVVLFDDHPLNFGERWDKETTIYDTGDMFKNAPTPKYLPF